ncbi:MAG: hypothetical protein R2729_03075 [Bryobacteraceae bacterium]
MKIALFLLATGAIAIGALAADSGGVLVWRNGVPPADAKNPKFGNHALSVSHRDKDGIPEVHEKVTDIFVIQSGAAELLVGGKVTGGKETAPGEIRGGRIEGGVRKPVAAGDVVHIPADTPHQFFVAKGKEVSYFVVKVDAY